MICQRCLRIACDRVPREKLWGVLREYGVDGRVLLAVRSPAQVFVSAKSEITIVNRGCSLHQVCVQSPLFFIVYIRVLLEGEIWSVVLRPERKPHWVLFIFDSIISWHRFFKALRNVNVNYLKIPKKHRGPHKRPLRAACVWPLVYMNWIKSHRRVDESVTVARCRIKRLLADDFDTVCIHRVFKMISFQLYVIRREEN